MKKHEKAQRELQRKYKDNHKEKREKLNERDGEIISYGIIR